VRGGAPAAVRHVRRSGFRKSRAGTSRSLDSPICSQRLHILDYSSKIRPPVCRVSKSGGIAFAPQLG